MPDETTLAQRIADLRHRAAGSPTSAPPGGTEVDHPTALLVNRAFSEVWDAIELVAAEFDRTSPRP
jgi:hypothetical protein